MTNPSARKFPAFTLLYLAIPLLALAHWATKQWGHDCISCQLLFDLDGESTIPVWFSSVLLLGSSMAAYFIAGECRTNKTPWYVLSAFMAFLSCDEVAGFHEKIGLILQHRVFAGMWMEKFKAPVWVLTLGPAALIFVFILARYLKNTLDMKSPATKKLLWGMAIYFTGCIGFEILLAMMFYTDSFINVRYEILLEETFEITGAVLFLHGLVETLDGMKLTRAVTVPFADWAPETFAPASKSRKKKASK